MKLRKILTGVVAASVAATTLAVSASAYEAFLMYTDDAWGWGVWNATDFPAGTVDVTADGTYTVYIDNTAAAAKYEDEETGEEVPATASGAMVFCVDIDGLGAALELPKKPEGQPADSGSLKLSDVKIDIESEDGTTKTINVDASKVVFGDVEANGKVRLELYNEYGDTKADPGFDKSEITFDKKIAVTFTITGLGGSDAATDNATAGNTNASTTDNKASNPETGVEGVAGVAALAVIATGAIIIAKKSK